MLMLSRVRPYVKFKSRDHMLSLSHVRPYVKYNSRMA